MKNCIILGSGRSGTSMVAGTLARAGYFMGEGLYQPRDSNPKGFFESPDINGINESLLARVTPRRPPVLGRWFFRDRPQRNQRWLARVPPGAAIPCPARTARGIARLVGREPYCFKDPRFCYTLPAWRPFLKGAVFVCVFREPAATAASIVKECRSVPYLRSLSMSFATAVEVWMRMYQHVLRIHRNEGEWIFVHFEQVLTGEGVTRLEQHLGILADRDFPEAGLRRSSSDATVPPPAMKLYEELCEEAGYHPANSEGSGV